MENKTGGMKPLEGYPINKNASKKAEPTPAEIELEKIKQELAEEKIKTATLSKRCILLGKALETLQATENDRNDAEVISLVNGTYYRREALKDAEKRRRVQEKKDAEAYEKACKRNAIALAVPAVIGFSAMLFGFVGFIHTALAALITGVSLLAFGYALNDCVYLLGRCE